MLEVLVAVFAENPLTMTPKSDWLPPAGFCVAFEDDSEFLAAKPEALTDPGWDGMLATIRLSVAEDAVRVRLRVGHALTSHDANQEAKRRTAGLRRAEAKHAEGVRNPGAHAEKRVCVLREGRSPEERLDAVSYRPAGSCASDHCGASSPGTRDALHRALDACSGRCNPDR